jgi:hypothetical protein
MEASAEQMAALNVKVDEYLERMNAGEFWCYRCHEWHNAKWFPDEACR